MILGRTKSCAFSGEIVVFFAGSDPLPTESQTLFEWLQLRGIRYNAIDVLTDPTLAPLAESASATPWLPMLSANGRVIGQSSLSALLGNPRAFETWLHAPLCRKIPNIWATREAVQQLGAHGKKLRLAISADMSHELSIEAARDAEWVVGFGDVELALDALSLARADGIVIRWVEAEQVQGFVFDNPNEALGVRRIRSEQLAAWLESEAPPLLIDVRSEAEYHDGRIAGARRLDAVLAQALTSLDRSTPIALYCNNGVRSTSTARRYGELGFLDVVALEGGLEAWRHHFEGVDRDLQPDV